MQATRLFTILLVSFSATADLLSAQTITPIPLYTFHGNENGGIISGNPNPVSGNGIAWFAADMRASDIANAQNQAESFVPAAANPDTHFWNNPNYLDVDFSSDGEMVALVESGQSDPHTMGWFWNQNDTRWNAQRQLANGTHYFAEFDVEIKPGQFTTPNRWGIVYQLVGAGSGPIIAIEYATSNQFKNPPVKEFWQVKIRGAASGGVDQVGYSLQTPFVSVANFKIEQVVSNDPAIGFTRVWLNGVLLTNEIGINNYSGRFSAFGLGMYSSSAQNGEGNVTAKFSSFRADIFD